MTLKAHNQSRLKTLARKIRLDAGNRRAHQKARAGKTPRRPTGVIASSFREMARISARGDKQLRETLQPFLGDPDGIIDEETAAEIRGRLRSVKEAPEREANAILVRTAEATDKWNAREVTRTTGMPAPRTEELRNDAKGESRFLAQWRAEHIAKIKGLSSASRDRIDKSLEEVGERGMRVETLIKRLIKQEKMSFQRARLVARDSVLTLNARLTQERHKSLGIEEYIWLATRDGSSRKHHLALDGKQFRYDDPPMGGGTGPKDTGNPGSGIGCRCQEIPVIPEFDGIIRENKPLPIGVSYTKVPKKKGKPEPLEEGERHRSIGAWEKSLSQPQLTAFKNWSEGFHKEVRAVQRGLKETQDGAPVTERMRRRVRRNLARINDALDTAPKYQGALYRGMAFSDDSVIRSMFKEGGLYKVEALTSFSKSREIAGEYSGEGKEGVVGVVIKTMAKTTRAHDISKASAIGTEHEVLVKKGELFSVKSVRETSPGRWLVVVEE